MLTFEQQNTIDSLLDLIKNKKESSVIQLIASAGSGKTYTIVKAVHTILELFPDFRIGMITFTKKSAIEMKKRLSLKQNDILFAGTLHSLAYSIVIKNNPSLKVIQNSDEILCTLYKEMIQKDIPFLDVSILQEYEKIQLNKLYQAYKKKYVLFDFDDLIEEATSLCANDKDKRFDLLIIDEFQDTSLRQIEFVISIGASYLFCVGDSKQSIYSFRGAHVDIFYTLKKYFSNIVYKYLLYNFRSQSHIVTLSNHFISQSRENFQKDMKATIKKGEKPTLYYFTKFYSMKQIWDNFYQDFYKRYKKKDSLCVLVRTNYMKQYLESYIDIKSEAIVIMTIHQAKGLEFKHVVIFGITKNNIPHHKGNFDEESRLFYVALTRAECSLSLIAWGTSRYYHQIEESEKTFVKGDSKFLSFLIKECRLSFTC